MEIESIQMYRQSPLDSNDAKVALDEMMQCKPNTVLVDVWVDARDDVVSPRFEQRDEVMAFIRSVKAKKLKVCVRVRHFPLPYGYYPDDIQTWFASFINSVSYWANMCKHEKVEYFIIGAELNAWEKPSNNDYFADLISEVRAAFPGEISYNMNMWHLMSGVKDSLEQKLNNEWFYDLDFLTVSAYWKVAIANNPSVESIINNWHDSVNGLYRDDIVEEHLHYVSDFFNKPILLEVGLASALGACQTPWAYKGYTTVSTSEQRNYYGALFNVFFDLDWIKGFQFDGAWHSTPLSQENGNNIEWTIQNKPAMDVLKEWFKGIPTFKEGKRVNIENVGDKDLTLIVRKTIVLTPGQEIELNLRRTRVQIL